MKTIVVIDGKGGGVGSALIARLKGLPGARLLALGANALATSAMLRAGAQDGATGENAVIQCCRQADIVTGPIGILGEITAPMAAAVGQSPARLVLIPNAKSGAHICGLQQMPLSQYIEEAAKKIEEILGE